MQRNYQKEPANKSCAAAGTRPKQTLDSKPHSIAFVRDESHHAAGTRPKQTLDPKSHSIPFVREESHDAAGAPSSKAALDSLFAR